MLKAFYENRLKRSRFYRNVMILMSGTALAQVLPVAALPVLSRLYTPEHFGTYGLFLTISTSLAVLATGRYELAIPLPRKNEDAFHLVVLSAVLTAGFSLMILIMTVFAREPVSRVLKNPEISMWLFGVSVSVLLLAGFQILNYWANRNNRYRDMAAGRVIQTGLMVVAALGLGFLNPGAGGLIVAGIAGQLAAVLFMAWRTFTREQRAGMTIRIGGLREQARRYEKFPRINSMHALMDMLQLNGIVFLISAFFGQKTLGFYSMTMRVLRTPLSFVGTSIAQVFYQRMSSDYSAGREIESLVRKTTVRLAALAFPVFFTLFLAGPRLFSAVLGPEWREAGVYAKILAPWLYLNFIYSPVSQLPLVLNRQGAGFFVGLGYNILILACVFIGYRTGDIRRGFTLISIFVTLYLIGTLFWLFTISRQGRIGKRNGQ
ncbi:MAG: oligosaccharide flippase family protein [bacterium]|nr:oligosaccharide flippase family protein [bacterium]